MEGVATLVRSIRGGGWNCSYAGIARVIRRWDIAGAFEDVGPHFLAAQSKEMCSEHCVATPECTAWVYEHVAEVSGENSRSRLQLLLTVLSNLNPYLILEKARLTI